MMAGVSREMGSLAGKAVLLVGVCGAAAMFVALFLVREDDVTAAREEVLRERSSGNTARMAPKVSRRDFEIRLPIPGERGKYEWKVRGRRSAPVDATTDRIIGFEGEMMQGEDFAKLSSPVAVFDKENRALSSQDGVVLESQWGKIEAREMVMGMKDVDPIFSGEVRTEIDREKLAATETKEAAPRPTDKNSGPKSAQGESKKEKKKSPLVITSEKLKLYPKENLAVFTGGVLAKDDSGTIGAEQMRVYYYSKEETEKDAKLKGIKLVECVRDVRIDQIEAKKQAVCARATYDAKTNIVLLEHDPETGKKVVYRDETERLQVEALWMILDRNKNEVTFEGEKKNQVTVIDFNPDRESFLGIMGPGEKKEPEKPKGEGEAGEKAQSGEK